ncbi:tripartite tricarboxylate transporter TctB family protein [Psychromonas arctica]|uniref:tripartite tricarboxylate transporter TctB family protein n=1 Tax=Psychromonas arctica TaxID=168275 RepID=UPI002FD1BD96
MSNIKSNWDGLTGLFSIVFGLAYGGYAYSLPQPMFGNPLEAIFLPLTVSAIAIFIGVLLIITGGMAPSIIAVKALLNESPKRKSDRRKVAITAIICVFYAMFFEHAGYVVSTSVFMFAMLTVTCGLVFWKKSLLISLIFAVSIFITFNEMLSVNLPPFPFFN